MIAKTVLGEFVGIEYSQHELDILEQAKQIVSLARCYYEDEDTENGRLGLIEAGLTELLEQAQS